MKFTSLLPKHRPWKDKFADAFRGIGMAVRGETSYAIHIITALLVVLAAAWLRVTPTEWGLLIVCITIVLAAEAVNSSIECVARAVDSQHNPELGKALDMSSGAVLLCAIGAACVGLVVFLHRLAWAWQWWG